MTNVDILFRYAAHPTEAAMFAISKAQEVYGIRHVQFNREAKTVRVEYDATRLNASTVEQLLLRSGLRIEEKVPLSTPASPPAPPAAAPTK